MNYLKKSIGIATIVLLAAACNSKTQPTAPSNPPSGNSSGDTGQTQTPPPQATYNSSQYNFTFNYPNSFTQVTPVYGNLKNQIIQVQLGNANYPKTNFSDADFTVSEVASTSINDCLKNGYPQSPASSGTTQKQINGINYYVMQGGDAGAGNFYASTIYRTFNNNSCFEMDETIHTTNIANYDPGTVTQIDTAPIQAQLDQILNSFTFTK